MQRFFRGLSVLVLLLASSSDAVSGTDQSQKANQAFVFSLGDDQSLDPLLWETMLSPMKHGKAKMDKNAISEILEEWNGFRGGMKELLKKHKPKPALSSLFQVIGFMQRHPEVELKGVKDSNQLLKKYHRLARYLAKKSQGKSKYVYLYGAMVADYFFNPKKHVVIKKLLSIRKQLPKNFMDRVDLISSIHLLDSRYTFEKGFKQLTKLAKRFDAKTVDAVFYKLTLARSVAGLSRHLQPIQKPQKGFLKILSSAYKKSLKGGEDLRGSAIVQSFRIWNNAKTKSKGLPFKLDPKRSMLEAGVVEQVISRNRSPEGVKKLYEFYWEMMAIHKENKEIMASLGGAIAGLIPQRYQSEPFAMQVYTDYRRLLESYSKTDFDRFAELKNRIDQGKSDWLRQLLATLQKPTYQKENLDVGLNVLNQEVRGNLDKKQVETYKSELGRLYSLAKKPDKASQMYQELVDAGVENQALFKQLYQSLGQAMGWQEEQGIRALIHNKADPALAEKMLASLEKLLSVSSPLNTNKQKLHRYRMAAVDLSIFLRRPDNAQKYWLQAAEHGGLGLAALNKVPMIVRTYFLNANFEQPLELLKKIEKNKLEKEFGRHRIDLTPFWRECHDKLAMVAEQNQNPKIAINHLQEFVMRSGKETNKKIANAYWRIFQLQTRLQEPEKALITLQQALTKPFSRLWRKRFLLAGHKEANRHTNDVAALSFGLTFLKEFPSEPDRVRVRDQLMVSLKRQGSLLELGDMASEQALDPLAPVAARIEAFKEARDSYSQLLKNRELTTLAAKMEQSLPQNPAVVALVAYHNAEEAVRKNQFAKLATIESKLAGLDSSVKDVRDATDYVRFHKTSATLPTMLASLPLDPKERIEKVIERQNLVQELLDRVCENEGSPFCAPAKYQIALFTNAAMRVVAGLELSTNFSEQDQNSFDILKNQSLNQLQEWARRSMRTARELADKGLTTPEWRRTIIGTSPSTAL